MGDRFARILRRTSEAHLVGICDNNPERAASVGATFGVPHYLATEDLLAREHPQLLVVCTPEDYHLAPCLAALERSIGVLVEKPIASSLEDAQCICDAAQRHSALLSVGHVLRYDTRFMLGKEAVDTGKVGVVQSLHARRWNLRVAQELHLKGRNSLAQFLGVHDYDLVRWFAGAEPIRVYAESRSRVLASYHVDDTAIALISFATVRWPVSRRVGSSPTAIPVGFRCILMYWAIREWCALVGWTAGWPSSTMSVRGGQTPWSILQGRMGPSRERWNASCAMCSVASRQGACRGSPVRTGWQPYA
jgi:predicted dehydrogenase